MTGDGSGRGADDEPIAAVERAMVRIRRSVTRRALGRLLAPRLGAPVDLGVLAVLGVVEAAGGRAVTVGEVATGAGIEPSRASRVVAAAIGAGHVRRVADQRDGRRVGLELTPAGRAVAAEVRALRREAFARAMAGWAAEDRARFATLLTRFVAGYENGAAG